MLNKRTALSQAISKIVPKILQGVHLDFLVRHSITYTQFLVLVAVHSQKEANMNFLAKSMHVRMPTMTGIVDRLVKAGHIRRVSHAKDRRQVHLSLTPKGEGFIRGFEKTVSKRWYEILQFFNEGDLDRFGIVIKKLKDRLGIDS